MKLNRSELRGAERPARKAASGTRTRRPRRGPGDDQRLAIVMVSPEAAPFAKTGGLADVAGALPLALGRLGQRVTLVMPRYRGVAADGNPSVTGMVALGGRPFHVRFFQVPLGEGASAVLVDCPDLYDREGLYGLGATDHPDNARRFAFLARAAAEWIALGGSRPSVVHAHDWQTGLLPLYLRTLYARHPAAGGLPTIFTIHNLAFQGLFGSEWLSDLDLSPDIFTVDGIEFWGRLSFLKAGINFSTLVTTVSRQYAREILTPELGFGFDGILARRRSALVGILNGIDAQVWDPAADPHLPESFTAQDLSGKRAARRELLRAFGLPKGESAFERPVVGMVSRLVNQKGHDLLAELGDELLRLDAAYVLLGAGESRYEEFWTALAARYPDRVGVRIGFDERLAHLVVGGADIFLMPSQFEPCGLSQMYSLRYGTVPVVRATGGLADTVRNYSERRGAGTGFTFRECAPQALLAALKRALAVYGQKPAWRRLQEAGMRLDHSWDASAREYVKVYRKAVRQEAAP